MNKIDELIVQLCPEGVEYKQLGELGQFENIGVDKKILEGQKKVMLLNFMDIMRNKHIDKKVLKMEVSASDSKIEKCDIKKYDVFITPSSETIDEIGFAAVVDEDIPNAVYSYHIMRYRLFEKNNVTPYFISYLFESISLRSQIYKASKGLTRFGLSGKDFCKLVIPLPPLSIQQEIVNILDMFSKVQAELQAELQARRKQYEYYRSELLSFEDNEVEWKSLGEVCLSISAGGDLPKNYNKGQMISSIEYPYPIYANATDVKGLYGYTDSYKIESDAVTISARGAKIGYHTIREAKFTPIIRLITLISNKEILSTKFLNYVLDITPIGGTSGGIPQLTVPTVKKIRIPIPPLAEQERIVGILDKFDALLNDLSEGLPAEIQARKKQYEYYRNKLLTFNNINNE